MITNWETKIHQQAGFCISVHSSPLLQVRGGQGGDKRRGQGREKFNYVVII
jgi:hypothetical protein